MLFTEKKEKYKERGEEQFLGSVAKSKIVEKLKRK